MIGARMNLTLKMVLVLYMGPGWRREKGWIRIPEKWLGLEIV